MENKIKKVNCKSCRKEIDCPENMINAEAHYCFECFEKFDEKDKLDVNKVHVDIPIDKANELLFDNLIGNFISEGFLRV